MPSQLPHLCQSKTMNGEELVLFALQVLSNDYTLLSTSTTLQKCDHVFFLEPGSCKVQRKDRNTTSRQ
eukprot:scaffold34507_cov44-Cyclotella_meneghiniana.AAC.1